MLGFGPVASTALVALSGGILVTFIAGSGTFHLNGIPVNFSFSQGSAPMALRRDYWDVDEWGRFIPGGGVRYTL